MLRHTYIARLIQWYKLLNSQNNYKLGVCIQCNAVDTPNESNSGPNGGTYFSKSSIYDALQQMPTTLGIWHNSTYVYFTDSQINTSY
jgi:hypothetical protein